EAVVVEMNVAVHAAARDGSGLLELLHTGAAGEPFLANAAATGRAEIFAVRADFLLAAASRRHQRRGRCHTHQSHQHLFHATHFHRAILLPAVRTLVSEPA